MRAIERLRDGALFALLHAIMAILAIALVGIEVMIVYLAVRYLEIGNVEGLLYMIGLMIIQTPVIYIMIRMAFSKARR